MDAWSDDREESRYVSGFGNGRRIAPRAALRRRSRDRPHEQEIRPAPHPSLPKPPVKAPTNRSQKLDAYVSPFRRTPFLVTATRRLGLACLLLTLGGCRPHSSGTYIPFEESVRRPHAIRPVAVSPAEIVWFDISGEGGSGLFARADGDIDIVGMPNGINAGKLRLSDFRHESVGGDSQLYVHWDERPVLAYVNIGDSIQFVDVLSGAVLATIADDDLPINARGLGFSENGKVFYCYSRGSSTVVGIDWHNAKVSWHSFEESAEVDTVQMADNEN